MAEIRHTELPWHVFEANNRYYIGAVGCRIAIGSTAPFNVVTEKGVQQLKTDMDFIVHACNTHHDLLSSGSEYRKIADKLIGVLLDKLEGSLEKSDHASIAKCLIASQGFAVALANAGGETQ